MSLYHALEPLPEPPLPRAPRGLLLAVGEFHVEDRLEGVDAVHAAVAAAVVEVVRVAGGVLRELCGRVRRGSLEEKAHDCAVVDLGTRELVPPRAHRVLDQRLRSR